MLDRLPLLDEQLSQLVCSGLEVHDKVFVTPLLAVVGLARWHVEKFRDLLQGKIVEQGAVVEDVVSLAPQAVSRELASSHRQVTCPLMFNGLTKWGQGRGNLLQDEPVSLLGDTQLGLVMQLQHEAVHQAPPACDNGSTPAASSQDRYLLCLAEVQVHFPVLPRGSANDDDCC